MKRRMFLGLSMITMAALLLDARAQPQTGNVDENVYARAAEWFRELFRPLEELANTIDKQRLIRYLRSLGRSFEAMLRDKREIASLVTQTPVPLEELQIIVERMTLNVRLASDRTLRVAFVLREQFRERGARVANDLSTTLLSRKAWLGELESQLEYARENGPGDNLNLAPYATRAKKSAAALDAALSQLADLVAYLEEQN